MVSKQARHLAALAAKRRSKRTEGTSSQPVQADSDPECDDVEARDSTSGDDKAHPAEEVGAAARRQRDTIRKRVFRNRWRGLGAAAAAMSAFIVRTSSQKLSVARNRFPNDTCSLTASHAGCMLSQRAQLLFHRIAKSIVVAVSYLVSRLIRSSN